MHYIFIDWSDNGHDHQKSNSEMQNSEEKWIYSKHLRRKLVKVGS